ncbi:hypothetical protein NL676_018012, partial [Syzygium grande]
MLVFVSMWASLPYSLVVIGECNMNKDCATICASGCGLCIKTECSCFDGMPPVCNS